MLSCIGTAKNWVTLYPHSASMLRERLRLSIGCLSVQFIRQWVITPEDKGQGGVTAQYPVTCTPLSAVASCTSITEARGDAVVTGMSNSQCYVDVTPSAYTGSYRVIIIGFVS